eukprot:TRINITY_DN22833_c0_g1_i1.p1 TRINITY_DN22833_c0_g1~~TRINITY_DN22833_c0_g1_i1.p1  ORF type:complete len:222 (-),score=19.38 TRINITY_DN22833_c0_g1_i1:48-713(-)
MYVQQYGQSESVLPSSDEVVSYTASWAQFYYLTVCTRPHLGSDLFNVRAQDGARERFQAWTVLKLFAFCGIELLLYQFNVFASFGFAVFHLPILTINVSVTVFFAHLAWYSVVKREGGSCGREGYVYWALWLAIEPAVLCIVSALFTDYIGWLRLLIWVPNFFLAASCLRLFTAPVTPVRTLVDRVTDAMEGAVANVRAATESCCGPSDTRAQEIRVNSLE